MSRDALIVGINTYQFLPGLAAPAQDAEAIAQCLHSTGDFRISRLPDIVQAGQSRIGVKTPVTLAELEAALVRLFKPKGNAIPHTALFYFSGHGLQKNAGIQEGYLATSDANPQAGLYGLSLFWLRRLLQESPVRQRIVLLDCCNSGELFNILEADPGAKAGTDRLFMVASREYEAAYESLDGNYSVFTQALLEGLNPTRLPSGIVTNYALTDWVSNALKGETQQPLFENSGSEIILTRCQSVPTLLQIDPIQDICPYRGLEFFDEAHAEYFFGREELTDQLVEKLRHGHFVAVVGASGSGKSSLVRAGLVHRLRQGQMFSRSDRWRIQLITPTDQPIKSLASAFVNANAPTVDRAEHLQRAEALLYESENALGHLVRASLMSAKQSRNERLVLVIDQFEEIFTLCQGPQAERDRRRFFNSLITALREANDCLSIVIVLRADFLGKCSQYDELSEHIEQNLVIVTPLTYEQIKASVVKPAQKVGLRCDPNLVYNILRDVVGAPGELPLLQYTLLELWHRRQPSPDGGAVHLTLAAYNELGGVRGTLQSRANEVFYSLSVDEQRIAKRIFLALTQLGEGTEDTRRRVLKSELITARYPAELVDRVLEKLVAAKLIVTNRIAPIGRDPECLDQDFANVSTALRLAQIRQGKMRNLPKGQVQSQAEMAQLAVLSLTTDDHRRSMMPSQSKQRLELNLSDVCQETIDVAHEALIRNWSLLRTWLDENRERIQRQRRLEHAAREWNGTDPSHAKEYLLSGDRLFDAENYRTMHPNDLSALAQRYITLSLDTHRRHQRQRRLLQMAVPCGLLAALAVMFNQYWIVTQTQAEKEHQLRIATSRQQAAIAQSILQEPMGDPTTALLISRLAAEQGGRTYEAQASLRNALQRLRFQADLNHHQVNGDGALLTTASTKNIARLGTMTNGSEFPIVKPSNKLSEQPLQWAFVWSSGITTRPAIGQTATNTVRQTATVPHTALSEQTTQIDDRTTNLAASKMATSKMIIAITPDGNIHHWQLPVREALETQAIAFGDDAANQDESVLPSNTLLTSIAERFEQWGTSLWQVPAFLIEHRSLPTWVNNTIHFATVSKADKAAGNPVAPTPVSPTTPFLQQVDALPTAVPFTHVALNEKHSLIATVNQLGEITIWQVNSTLKRLHHFQTPSSSGAQTKPTAAKAQTLAQLAFSPNGQRLLGVGSDRTLYLWDVASGRLIQRLQGHQDDITQAAFSPDGEWLASASRDYTVQLWQVASGKQMSILRHQTPVNSAHFSPNGMLIVTASQDGIVRVIDRITGDLRVIATGHQGAVMDAAFSPDGKTLVTAGTDGTARLWDAQKGTEQAILRSLQLHTPEPLQQALFSPDGRYVATINQSGQMQLWSATWDGLLKLARDRSSRQLKPKECLRYLRLAPNVCPQL